MAALLRALKALLGLAERVTASGDPPPAGGGSAPGVDPAKDLDALRDSIAQERADLTATGTGLAAIAVGAFATIGYTRIDDLFPFPADAPRWLASLTGLAAGGALLAATILVVRFYWARRKILIDSRLKTLGKVDAKTVIPVAHHMAYEQGAASLLALDLRVDRLARIAHRLDPYEQAKDQASATSADAKLALKARTEADRVQHIVQLSLLQCVLYLLQRRSRGALGSPTSAALIVIAVLGVGFTFGVADWAKSHRSEPTLVVARAAACTKKVHASSSQLQPKERATLRAACVAKAKTAIAPSP